MSAQQTWTRLLEFFKSTYFDILEHAGYLVVYHHDSRLRQPVTGQPGISGIGRPLIPIPVDIIAPDTVSTWEPNSWNIDMRGFDQITVTSQGSINYHFQQLWLSAQTGGADPSLCKWYYEQYFRATFKPIQVRLLSNERAIIWIYLQEGSLRTLRADRRLPAE